MSPTQTKIPLLASVLVLSLAAGHAAERQPGQEIAPGVRLLARMSDARIAESSGVAASRQHPKMLWTHNDGGGAKKQVLYAIDRAGQTRGAWPVVGAKFQDWEDLASDHAGHLYLADIGNNDAKRDTLNVHAVDEPDPQAAARPVSVKRGWTLKFPGAPFDCESLFIWKDCGYVVSKVFASARAQIFRFPLKDTTKPLTLELVATTQIQSPVTGADISADGKRLALVAKSGAYVFRIDGDVGRVTKTKPHYTILKDEHIEGCCFLPDGLLVTSENRDLFLFTDPAFRGP